MVRSRLRDAAPLVAAVALAGTAAPATAGESPFLGIGGGGHQLHFDSDDRDRVDAGREQEFGGHIRVGTLQPDWRLYGQWTVIRPSPYFFTQLTVNADLLWQVAPWLTLYAGGGAGLASLSWNSDNSSDAMAAFSVQAGALVPVTERLSVELDLRQTFTRLRTDPDGPDGDSVDVSLDRIGAAALNFNLRF